MPPAGEREVSVAQPTLSAFALGQRTRRAARVGAANFGLLAVAVSGVLLAIDSAAGPSHAVPLTLRGNGAPDWLLGPLHSLGGGALGDAGYGLLVLAMTAGYLLLLSSVEDLGPRRIVAVLCLLHAVFMLAPPLGSTDVAGYVAY